MTGPRSNPLESSITAKILQALRSRGAWAVKVHVSQFQMSGTPDVIACHRGRFIALEVKRNDRRKATRLQEFTLQEIQAAGGTALVVWDVSMVGQILDAIDRQCGV